MNTKKSLKKVDASLRKRERPCRKSRDWKEGNWRKNQGYGWKPRRRCRLTREEEVIDDEMRGTSSSSSSSMLRLEDSQPHD